MITTSYYSRITIHEHRRTILPLTSLNSTNTLGRSNLIPLCHSERSEESIFIRHCEGAEGDCGDLNTFSLLPFYFSLS